MAVAPLRGPAAHRPDDRATDRHSHRRRVIHIVDDISITVVNPTKMLDMDSQPSLRSSTVRDWAGLAARIILGATLLVAGIIKATDIDSTIWSVRTYQIVPWDLAPLIGWTMPILEIVVGLMLIFGIATRWSGLLRSVLPQLSFRCYSRTPPSLRGGPSPALMTSPRTPSEPLQTAASPIRQLTKIRAKPSYAVRLT